jgi:tetratricopeptide (TPR) repeat protein
MSLWWLKPGLKQRIVADLIAGLEEQREFLLASLDDLEAEYAAGDLDDTDYRALKANYTIRAAGVIRSIEAKAVADAAPRRSWGRVAAWTAGIVVTATLAGVLVAQFSGSRSAGDSITGDIRTTSRELLVDAQQAFGAGDLAQAIEIYDEVLEIQPSSTEALAYKAWMLRLSGDLESAVPLIEDAVAIDPAYPDARVFGAVISLDLGDVALASTHLDVFDTLDAPPFMDQLVEQQGLRTRIDLLSNTDALDRVEAVLMVDDPPAFGDTDLTIDEVLLAAEALAADRRVVEALELVQQVNRDQPGDAPLLAGYGWLLARSATAERPEPAELAVDRLDEALSIDPGNPEALVYRAFVFAFLDQPAKAAADLAQFRSLDTQPPELLELIAVFDLQGQID